MVKAISLLVLKILKWIVFIIVAYFVVLMIYNFIVDNSALEEAKVAFKSIGDAFKRTGLGFIEFFAGIGNLIKAIVELLIAIWPASR